MLGACAREGEQLVVSFELGTSVDSVIAIEAVVDVQSAAVTLAPWWQFGPGGCRFGDLKASANFLAWSACADAWQGGATFDGPPVYSPGAPRGGANQARIVMSFAVPSDAPRTFVAGARYYGVRLEFMRDSSATCAGCDVPACLLLNSIRFVREPGAIGGDVILQDPGVLGANQVTWQSSTASCSAVPVRRLTWGRLKTLYR